MFHTYDFSLVREAAKKVLFLVNTIDGAKGWITKKRVLRQEVYKKVKSIQIVIQKSLCKDEQSSFFRLAKIPN